MVPDCNNKTWWRLMFEAMHYAAEANGMAGNESRWPRDLHAICARCEHYCADYECYGDIAAGSTDSLAEHKHVEPVLSVLRWAACLCPNW